VLENIIGKPPTEEEITQQQKEQQVQAAAVAAGKVPTDEEIKMAAEAAALKQKFFMKHPSIFIVSDGRRAASHRAITSALLKASKTTHGEVGPPTPFRLMHTNAEFSKNKFAALRNHGNCMNATVPEPLETLSICANKKFKVQPVARKYLDLPGSNRTRGFNNVPLKNADVSTSWAQRCEILAGSSKAAPMDEEQADWMVPADQDDEAMPSADDATAAAEEDIASKTCDLFPWEHHELVARELLNCFDVKTVIHYNTGCTWALACARHSRHFIGFARNAAHVEHVNKTLVAMVLAEMIEGKHDGFSVTRFLSAQRSLGGSDEDRVAAAPTPALTEDKKANDDDDDDDDDDDAAKSTSSKGTDSDDSDE